MVNAIQRWNDALEAKIKTGMPRARAVSAVAREDPELHAQFLEATGAPQRAAVAREEAQRRR